jgi:hypothetical protein
MPFRYQITVSDPNGTGASISAVLTADLARALDVWSSSVDGQGTLNVTLSFQQTSTGRFAGGVGGVVTVAPNVVETSALYELTTGQHAPGTTTDINIIVDTGSAYTNYLDLSTNLTTQSTVPSGKYNPIELFLHELGHSFGFIGYYSQSGAPLGATRSIYDTMLRFGADGTATLTGTNVEAVYGSPVPITTNSSTGQNYYHFGTTQSDIARAPADMVDPLSRDLMNGIVYVFGYQYTVSALDLAVMRDLGYSIPNIALTGTAGADTIRVGTGHYAVDGGAGIDTLVVPATSSGYTVTTSSVSSGSNQFDLANVERVQFTDKNLALDVGPTGSAGQAVELIGAVLGTGMLANPSVVGIAIGLFDSGQTMQQIAQLCIDRGLLPADNAGLVGKLWLDVVGSSIDAGNLANFTGLLQGSGGTMAAADLVVLAATNTVNLQHVGLVGLASTGIAYS